MRRNLKSYTRTKNQTHAQTPFALLLSDFSIEENPIYIDQTVFVTIDVQGEFCISTKPDIIIPQETIETCEKIQSLSEAFRKAGVKNYHVYYYGLIGERDFFKVKPDREAGDRVIAKSADSAFEGSNIDVLLQLDEKKTLLISGFNLSACVLETALDARKAGYNVYVLTDIAKDVFPDDKYTQSSYKTMAKKGVHLIDSVTAFSRLKMRAA
jgi:nicotinamidase-related amidase